MKKFIFLFLIIATVSIFLWLRLGRADELVTCSTDQGVHLIDTFEMWQSKRPVLIGPSSSLEVEARRFFFGPLTYYIALPGLVFSSWELWSVSWLLISLQLIAGLLVFSQLVRLDQKFNAFVWLSLFWFSWPGIKYSFSFWNPNFTYSFAAFLMVQTLVILNMSETQVKNLVKRKSSIIIWLILGLTTGLGAQFHYSFILVFGLSFCLIIWRQRKIDWQWLLALIGWGIGMSPLVLFEFRNEFYNLQTIWLFIRSSTETGQSSFVFDWYYLLPVLPFLFYFLSQFKAPKLLKIICVFVFLLGSLLSFPPQKTGVDMIPGWNCAGYQKMTSIILDQKIPQPFNLVQMLAGDSRAMFLRSQLVVNGLNPQPVESYPEAQTLFVYGRVSAEEIDQTQVWEVTANAPWEITEKWPIQNEVILYRLDKSMN